MYYVQFIFKDEDLRMKNGQPSHQAIMKRDEGSLSNLKGVEMKGGVFMTPTLSHQIGWFRQGGTVFPRVWEEKGACPFTTRKEWEKLFFISIFCYCFETLKRRGNIFGKDKKERERKTSRMSGKIKL